MLVRVASCGVPVIFVLFTGGFQGGGGKVLLELYDGLKSIVGVCDGGVGEMNSHKWRE